MLWQKAPRIRKIRTDVFRGVMVSSAECLLSCYSFPSLKKLECVALEDEDVWYICSLSPTQAHKTREFQGIFHYYLLLIISRENSQNVNSVKTGESHFSFPGGAGRETSEETDIVSVFLAEVKPAFGHRKIKDLKYWTLAISWKEQFEYH